MKSLLNISFDGSRCSAQALIIFCFVLFLTQLSIDFHKNTRGSYYHLILHGCQIGISRAIFRSQERKYHRFRKVVSWCTRKIPKLKVRRPMFVILTLSPSCCLFLGSYMAVWWYICSVYNKRVLTYSSLHSLPSLTSQNTEAQDFSTILNLNLIYDFQSL